MHTHTHRYTFYMFGTRWATEIHAGSNIGAPNHSNFLGFSIQNQTSCNVFKDVATYLLSILTLFKKAIEIWLVVWNMSDTLW